MKIWMTLVIVTSLLVACHTASQEPTGKLVGNWIEVMPANPQIVQGVTLHADGTAASIGMATLKCESWKLIDKQLVLNGKSIGNKQTLDFSDTLDVIVLTADSMRLVKHGSYCIEYYRVNKIPTAQH